MKEVPKRNMSDDIGHVVINYLEEVGVEMPWKENDWSARQRFEERLNALIYEAIDQHL